MCLIGVYTPSTKITSILAFPQSLWSSLAELSDGLQSSFCPKENLTRTSHVLQFFKVMGVLEGLKEVANVLLRIIASQL